MEEAFAQLERFIPLLIPLVVLQLGLMVFALIDLSKRTAVRGSKMMWVLIIVLVNMIGPILYFVLGRQEE